MIKENIDFLRKMVWDKRDLYSILSFLSESIDTLRTDLMGYHPSSDDVYFHLENILNELISLDNSIDSYKSE